MILLQALKHVQNNRDEEDSGICKNVTVWLMRECDCYKERKKALAKMHEMMCVWPGKTGDDPRYPVEGSCEKYMVSMCDGTLWKNARRYELLDWMIKELENEHAPT